MIASVVATIMLTVLSLTVWAGTPTPKDGEYEIQTADELIALFADMEKGKAPDDATVKLMADIDVGGALVTLNKTYSGVFDGNGKTLSGLDETLFHDFRGVVKDLTLRGDIDYTKLTLSLEEARKAASFARSAQSATMTGLVSYVNVTVSRIDLNVGGLVGYAKGNTTLTDCAYYGKLSVSWIGNGAGVGGVIGWTDAASDTILLDGCTFDGSISLSRGMAGKTAMVGGIVGNVSNNTVTLKNCVSGGAIKSAITNGTDYVGGIVGYVGGDACSASGCVNRASVTAVSYGGGILGGASSSFKIVFSANHGAVTAKTAGAFVGAAADGKLTVSDSVNFIKGTLDFAGTKVALENCYTGDDVVDLEKDFTVDGVAYKRYNIGICEKESGRLVPTIATNEAFSSFISIKDEGTVFSMRFVFLLGDFNTLDSVTVSIAFLDGAGKTVKEKVGTLAKEKSDFSLFSVAKARGETFFAKGDQLIFGCVITEIPHGAFETVSVTLVDTASGEERMKPSKFDYRDVPLSLGDLPTLSSLGDVSQTYNAGPGLLLDKDGTTKEDNMMKVISNTTAKKLLDYTKALEENGYCQVSTNTLDGDTYYTYEKYGKLIYLYHNTKIRETRVIVDAASDKLSEIEANHTPIAGEKNEFYQYSLNYDLANKAGYDPVVYTENTSQNCGMMYVIKLADNSVIVIDGGGDKQSTQRSRAGFLKFLREITKTGDKEKVKIASWFFSHAHGDHVRFASDFIMQHASSIDLMSVTHNFPSYQVVGSGYDDNTFSMKSNVNRRFPNTLYHKLHTGEVLNMAGVKIEVVYTHEDATTALGKSEIGDFNSTSTVLKIMIDGMSIMLLGDISDVAENTIVAMHTAAYIKSDMVQVTHHGFNFLNKLYPMINAKIAVFPQSAFYVKDPNNGQSNLYKYQQVMTYSDEEYFAHKYTYRFTVENGAFKAEALPRYDAK